MRRWTLRRENQRKPGWTWSCGPRPVRLREALRKLETRWRMARRKLLFTWQYRVEAAGIRRQPPPRSGASVMPPIASEQRDLRRIRSQAHTKHPLDPV